MDRNQLKSLLPSQGGTESYNPTALIEQFRRAFKPLFELQAYQQYYPEYHKVNNKAERQDKMVFVPTGEKDKYGNDIMGQKSVSVARLTIPYQELIVERSVQFLTGGDLVLKCDPQNDTEKQLFETVSKVWKDNKLQFKNGKIATAMKSELEVAELWYSTVDPDSGKVSLKMKVLQPSLGFTLIPVFDPTDDLIAFGVQYETADKVEHFDLYTDDMLVKHVNQGNNNWQVDGEIVQLKYGKMPIIYYSQTRSEWNKVQPLIERQEEALSNFADTNDYNGAPILFSKGGVKSLPAKGTAGKVVEAEGDNADLRYVTWDQAPASIKLELETIEQKIYSMTQTPNISFDQMKGLGDISGVAFDRIMIDAHLKAKGEQNGTYGECIQRRINFLISACCSIDQNLKSAADLDITPQFNLFKIDDEADRINNAMAANGGKAIMSQETSITYAGLVDNAQEEFKKIQDETDPLGAEINDALNFVKQPQNQ